MQRLYRVRSRGMSWWIALTACLLASGQILGISFVYVCLIGIGWFGAEGCELDRWSPGRTVAHDVLPSEQGPSNKSRRSGSFESHET